MHQTSTAGPSAQCIHIGRATVRTIATQKTLLTNLEQILVNDQIICTQALGFLIFGHISVGRSRCSVRWRDYALYYRSG